MASLADLIFSPYVLGPEIAMLATLMVISILGLMYIISPFLGQTSIRMWIRTKLYDEISAIIFVFAFLAFGTIVATFPIANAFIGIGIVPDQCNYHVNSALSDTINNTNLYFLSVCDVNNYNGAVGTFNTYTYYLAGLTSVAPIVGLSYPGTIRSPVSGAASAAEGGGFGNGVVGVTSSEQTPEEDFNSGEIPGLNNGGVTDTGIGISTQIDLLPIYPTFHYVIPMLNMLYIFFILAQVQMLLISAAPLIFALLMALGLVARSFGITRSFGGAMIAFAIGIGFIYPLVTSISYGFLDYSIQYAGQQFLCAFGVNPTSVCPLITTRILESMGTVFTSFFSLNFGEFVAQITAGPIILPIFRAFVMYSGLVAMGLTLIPLLNLTVVDAFIVDFSKAMGERMDFLSLLTRIL